MELKYQVSRVSCAKELSRRTDILGATEPNLRRTSLRTVELTPVEAELPKDGSQGWRTGVLTLDVRDKDLAKRLELGATVTLAINE
jgi:hypothetical protein